MLMVLCGLPGSGKTTLSNKIAEFYNNICVYHYDEWQNDLKRQSRSLAKNNMYSEIRTNLLHGADVVVDDLHLKKEDRI